jgi:uncharacterized membrane protein (DUF4010 family)
MWTEEAALFYRFAVALGIGIIIGFERERKRATGAEMFAGVRTFAVLALVGATAALLADHTESPLPLVAVVLGVSALLVAAYVRIMEANHGTGLTTEIAALLTLLIGALCYYRYVTLAAAIGVALLVLLSLKPQLHRVAERITWDDIEATIKFAVVSLIILPILPDRSFFPPPFDVLNPAEIWWMVVLISALNFAGYVLMKVVDPKRSIGLTGALGGLASSTAVTLTFAGRSRQQPVLGLAFAFAILLAWSIMFPRVLVIAWATSRSLVALLWLPLLGAALVGGAYAWFLYRRSRNEDTSGDGVKVDNPFELSSALKFGLLYAVVLVVARAAQLYFGNTGVYVSAIVSGMADLDAITLSMATLTNQGELTTDVASQAIVLAAVSNTVVKALIVISTGTAMLRNAILPAVPLMVAVALAAAWLL